MAEQVFNTCALGRQAGTFYEVGASVPATLLYPVSEPISIDLDRASHYPAEDFGKNFDAYPSRGSHGIRGASLALTSEARFQDIIELFEMHFTGDVTPTGTLWAYPLEVDAPTLVPYTIESGSEVAQDQWEAVGVLIDELTLGFDDLESPGAHPWNVTASALAVDRAVAALTPGLSGLSTYETMQGHLSLIKLGTTATAFASLGEIANSLVSCSITTRRHLIRRPYGSTGDIALGYGFESKTEGEMTFKVRIAAATKTDLHDAWNSSGADLGEQRIRITVDGSGTNVAHFDARIGLTAVPVGERSGERVYECTGKLVYDDTLDAGAQWSVDNGLTELGTVSGGS